MKTKTITKNVTKFILIFIIAVLVATVVLATAITAEQGIASAEDTDINGRTRAERKEYNKLKREMEFQQWDSKMTSIRGKIDANKKRYTNVDDIGSDVFNVVNGVLSAGLDGFKDFDIMNAAYQTVKSTAVIVATCFGFGGIANGVAGFIDQLLTIGEKEQSELEALESRINDQFDDLRGDIADTRADINELSNKIDRQTEEILNGVGNAFAEYEARNKVDEFFALGNDAFSYKQFKGFLYGENSLDSQLLDVVMDVTATDETVKRYYDNLYYSLMNGYADGTSNYQKLIDKVVPSGVVGSKPVQQYYYDYLVANEHLLNGESAENVAIDFIVDLYSTLIYAGDCIEKCNVQQMLEMYNNNGEYKKPDVNSTYNFGGDRLLTYDNIVDMSAFVEEQETEILKQMLKDLAYITNIGGSFILENEDASVGIVEVKPGTVTSVFDGQTIYMNQFTSDWCNTFGLDENAVSYVLITDEGNQIVSNKVAVDDIAQSVSNFTIRALYENVPGDSTEVYSINFQRGTLGEFAGGDGTKNSPYLIKNASQFDNFVANAKAEELRGNVEYYKLVDNISLSLNVRTSICNGDPNETFEDYFDGNGYTISSNYSMDSGEYGGLFGYIDEDGVVENLTLKNISFTSNNNEEKYVYGGAIAGYSAGTIQNVTIDGVSVINVLDDNVASHVNKSLNTYTGGIVGYNDGVVCGCKVVNSAIEGQSTRDFQTNPAQNNMSYVYTGGIVGFVGDSGVVKTCYVASSDIKGHCISKCKDNVSTIYPYLVVKTSGYIGESTGAISNAKVESNVTYKATFDIKNSGGSVLESNCQTATSMYLPNVDNKHIENNSLNENNVGAGRVEQAEIESLGDNYAENPKYKEIQVYRWGDFSFNSTIQLDDGKETNGYKIIVNGDTQNPIVNYDIVNCSFNIPEDVKNGECETWVDVFAIATYNQKDLLFKFELPILIKENVPIELVVEATRDYVDGNIQYSADSNAFAKDEKIKLVYENGDFETFNASNFYLDEQGYYVHSQSETSGARLTDFVVVLGENIIKLKKVIADKTFIVECKIWGICNNHIFTTNVVGATCTQKGYTLHECIVEQCKYSYQTDFTDATEHNSTRIDSASVKSATCLAEGYTGDTVCDLCSVIVRRGKATPKLAHKFENENNQYVCYCNDCNVVCTHEKVFTTDEGNELKYTCADCGYFYLELKDLTSIPRVIVSDAYALPTVDGQDNIVTIYVQILNNPGITGASCSVYFSADNGGDQNIELVSFEQANILPNALFVPTIVRQGLLAITMARAETDYQKQGSLFKLQFKLPNDARAADIDAGVDGSSYTISLAYTLSNDQFTDEDGVGIDIVTLPGKIRVVDHLPGDVNSDGVVDIQDATIIAMAVNNMEHVNDEYLECANYNSYYADVNLDGGIGVGDIVRILRYLVGGYDAPVLSKTYELTLDHNDLSGKTFSKVVTLGEQYGSFGEVTRTGYTFLGWFTQKVGGIQITEQDIVEYNREQYNKTHKQVLYAQWMLNELVLDSNGATDLKINGQPATTIDQVVTYKTSGGYVDLSNYQYEKEITVTVCDYDGSVIKQMTYKLTFVGWQALVGETKTQYDLKEFGFGKVRLQAIWENLSLLLDFTPTSEAGSTHDGWLIEGKTTSIRQPKGEIVNTICEDVKISPLYSDTKYTFRFSGNNATGGNPPSDIDHTASSNKIIYATGVTLPSAGFTKKGYTFVGWATNPNESIGSSNIKEAGATVSPSDLKATNSTIRLYAIWRANKYIVRFNGNGATDGNLNDSYDQEFSSDKDEKLTPNQFKAVGKIFVGWSDEQGATTHKYEDKHDVFQEAPLSSSDNAVVNLYAVWSPIKYKVRYYSSARYEVEEKMKADEFTYGIEHELATCEFTREGYAFYGWILSNGVVVRPGEKTSNLTAENGGIADVKAQWVKTSITWTSGDREIDIKENTHQDNISTDFDIDKLTNLGYTKFKITVKFNVKEYHDGYQTLKYGNYNDWIKFEDDKTGPRREWRLREYTFENISEFKNDLCLTFGADGLKPNGWYLGATTVIIEAVE